MAYKRQELPTVLQAGSPRLRPSPRVVHGHLAMLSHGKDGEGSFWGPFIREPISLMRDPSSWSNHLSKAQPPTITWSNRAPIWTWGTHSVYTQGDKALKLGTKHGRLRTDPGLVEDPLQGSTLACCTHKGDACCPSPFSS